MRVDAQRVACTGHQLLTHATGSRSFGVWLRSCNTTSASPHCRHCVQGSVCGLIMWNLILDELLDQVSLPSGCHLQAFADDVLLVTSASAIQDLEIKTNTALNIIDTWGEDVKLKFGPSKTQLVAFTPAAKQANIYMTNQKLTFETKMKYLGMIIDEKLTFNEHVQYITEKALKLHKRLSVFTRATWGPHPENIRTIYNQVIVPIVTYAAGVWGGAAKKEYVRTKLDSLQRLFAIKAIRAFRTVSTVAATALARMTPLHLKVKEVWRIEQARLTGRTEILPDDIEMERPTPVHQLLPPPNRITVEYKIATNDQEIDRICPPGSTRMYTDGSKLDTGEVGAAFVAYHPEQKHPQTTRKFKLHFTYTVFQAELLAIHRACEWALGSRSNSYTILSDSMSSLQALADRSNTNPQVAQIHKTIHTAELANKTISFIWVKAHVGIKGNEEADCAAKAAATLHSRYNYAMFPISYVKHQIKEETQSKWTETYRDTVGVAEHTRRMCPELDDVTKVIEQCGASFWLSQVLTGHGYHRQYLCRFKIIDNDICPCISGAIQNIDHLLFECEDHARWPFKLTDFVTDLLWPLFLHEQKILSYYSQMEFFTAHVFPPSYNEGSLKRGVKKHFCRPTSAFGVRSCRNAPVAQTTTALFYQRAIFPTIANSRRGRPLLRQHFSVTLRGSSTCKYLHSQFSWTTAAPAIHCKRVHPTITIQLQF
ncbi:hypothetical protein evm_010710 [Chilo suppressalis]|nr:hypothetical protein evm_010710 [Chilo suppressalis]